MKTLFLSKRHYTGHDLHVDRYGRIHALAASLARAGHDVQGISTSYRKLRGDNSFEWSNTRWTDHGLTGLVSGFLGVGAVTQLPRADVVISSSDSLHIVLGDRLAGRMRCPHIVDLYDDFEAFGLTRQIPGLVGQFRAALGRAAGIVCVTAALQQKIHQQTAHPSSVAIGNGVDTTLFHADGLDMGDARRALGLPEGTPMIGLPGGLNSLHGIEELFESLRQAAPSLPANISLVLAGNRASSLVVPRNIQYIDLGRQPHAIMPAFYHAMNLILVPNRPGLFGDACFPMKLAEAVACGRPVLATATPSVRGLLADQPDFLYTHGDSAQFTARIRALLENPRPPQIAQELRWDVLGQDFERFVTQSAKENSGG